MGAYVATLYGAINVVYERDLSLHLAVVRGPHLDDGADPYDGADTFTQLIKVGDWWHAEPSDGHLSPRHRALPSGQSGVGRHRVASRPLPGDFRLQRRP